VPIIFACDCRRTLAVPAACRSRRYSDSIPASPNSTLATIRPTAPFRQLLPLCGAVVHHGGIGTTAAALEAGCPQLVLPPAWDQPDNAARVAELGAGLVLGSRRRSSGHMSRALARLMAPDFGDRCRAIASRAGGEDGLELAAGWVAQLAGMAKR
jgi:rhamnosyltransferase subunit B